MPRAFLFKIGRREHIASLMNEGIVHMKRLGWYADREKSAVGDPNEGLLEHYSGKTGKMRLELEEEIDGTVVSSFELHQPTLRIYAPERNHGVYCMSGIEVPEGVPPLSALGEYLKNPSVLGFGDTLLMVKNSQEFANRMQKAARFAGFALAHGRVEYMPLDYCGQMSPFRKLEDYAYQQEWRFITTKPIAGDFIDLTLGSLDDIAAWSDLTPLTTHRGASVEQTLPEQEPPGP